MGGKSSGSGGVVKVKLTFPPIAGGGVITRERTGEKSKQKKRK